MSCRFGRRCPVSRSHVPRRVRRSRQGGPTTLAHPERPVRPWQPGTDSSRRGRSPTATKVIFVPRPCVLCAHDQTHARRLAFRTNIGAAARNLPRQRGGVTSFVADASSAAPSAPSGPCEGSTFGSRPHHVTQLHALCRDDLWRRPAREAERRRLRERRRCREDQLRSIPGQRAGARCGRSGLCRALQRGPHLRLTVDLYA